LTDFFWAVGIEDTFIPQTRAGMRPLEEYALTQHYDFWRDDFDRIAGLGVSHVRWGIPWYRVNPEPGRFEWGWVDEALEYLVNVAGLRPIVDLIHYGTPEWLDNTFINAHYPERVADYAHAFAERYGDLVRFYTPCNEPGLNAELCGRVGVWPPYLIGADGYVKVQMQIARGMVLAAEAIRAADPDAVLVQVEALGWLWTADERLAGVVERAQEHNYLAFDLFTGRVGHDHPMRSFLLDNGVAERELDWLAGRAAAADILGVNFYPWSGGELTHQRSRKAYVAKLRTWVRGDVDEPVYLRRIVAGQHLAPLFEEAWQRYRLPMMVTETSSLGDVNRRALWMDETIGAVRQARQAGLPIVGYTWFPAISMVDWRYRIGRRPVADYLIHLGLWDCRYDPAGILRREPTPLVERYGDYVAGRR
jgi:beta-glucosidase/6-phospho-beta-glucosidase/beta-galactosidase